MKKIQTTPLYMYESSKKDNHISRNPCLFCGKEVKEDKYYVHLLTNGDLINSDEDFDNSQGFHVVGSECKKKIRSSFIFKK